MTDSDPGTPASTSEKWLAYLRRVSFLDLCTPEQRAQKSLGSLIHVAQRILLDGEEISRHVIDPAEGWAVLSAGAAETVVSFSVRADHITPIVFDAEGNFVTPPLICGRPVEAPPDQPWEEYDRLTRTPSGFKRAPARMVRVYIRVPEVEIGDARPKAGGHVTDGGIVGTLVKCEQCSGGGLLHQPDPDELHPAQEPTA